MDRVGKRPDTLSIRSSTCHSDARAKRPLPHTFLATASRFSDEDAEIRQAFGRIIGRVADSHWWSIGDVVEPVQSGDRPA